MSDGARADLMELLGWRFEHVRSSSGFQSRPGTSALSGYVSRALTPKASLDLGSNFIELRFWEIRGPPWGGLLDRRQAGSPTEAGFLLRFLVATAVIRFE